MTIGDMSYLIGWLNWNYDSNSGEWTPTSPKGIGANSLLALQGNTSSQD